MNSTSHINTFFFFCLQQIDLQVGYEVAVRGRWGSEASCLMMKGCSALELQNSLDYVGRDEGHKNGKKYNHNNSKACQAAHADVCRGSSALPRERGIPVAGSENVKVK